MVLIVLFVVVNGEDDNDDAMLVSFLFVFVVVAERLFWKVALVQK